MRFRTFLSVGVILLFLSVFVFAAIDLMFTAEGITHSPVPVIAGKDVTYTASFRASSGAWVSAEQVTNCKVIGGVDGATIFVKTYPTFPANQTRTATFNWTATTGSHKVWFVIDPNHKTKDVHYDNNRIEETFSVGPAIGVQDDTPQVSIKHTRKVVPFKAPQVLTGPAGNPSVVGVDPDQNLLKKWIKVTDPHTGDYWNSGTNYSIKWETNITQGTFMIELYKQYGNTKAQFIDKSSSTSYLWKVALKPTLNSGLYRIRISYPVGGRAGKSAEGFSEPFYISIPAGQGE